MTKRELIMERALELFAENGFEATSVQQITERCGISKGAFYLYFKSKDELILSIIERFMSGFIADLEHTVTFSRNKGNLLYDFLLVTFTKFREQADFAKIFLKEQVFSFSEELIHTLKFYQSAFCRLLFSVIQKRYAHLKPDMQLELFFTMNGLIKSYAELIFFEQYPAELERICRAMVEKADIMAKHASIASLSEEYFQTVHIKPEIDKETVAALLEDVARENEEDPLVRESAELLLKDLENPKFTEAITAGLLNNISNTRSGKWAAYMYRQFLQQKK